MINYCGIQVNENSAAPADDNVNDIQRIDGAVFNVMLLEPGQEFKVIIENEMLRLGGKKWKPIHAEWKNNTPVVIPALLRCDDGTDGISVYVADANDDDVTIGVVNKSKESKKNITVAYMFLKEKYEARGNISEEHKTDYIDKEWSQILKAAAKKEEL